MFLFKGKNQKKNTDLFTKEMIFAKAIKINKIICIPIFNFNSSSTEIDKNSTSFAAIFNVNPKVILLIKENDIECIPLDSNEPHKLKDLIHNIKGLKEEIEKHKN